MFGALCSVGEDKGEKGERASICACLCMRVCVWDMAPPHGSRMCLLGHDLFPNQGKPKAVAPHISRETCESVNLYRHRLNGPNFTPCTDYKGVIPLGVIPKKDCFPLTAYPRADTASSATSHALSLLHARCRLGAEGHLCIGAQTYASTWHLVGSAMPVKTIPFSVCFLAYVYTKYLHAIEERTLHST